MSKEKKVTTKVIPYWTVFLRVMSSWPAIAKAMSYGHVIAKVVSSCIRGVIPSFLQTGGHFFIPPATSEATPPSFFNHKRDPLPFPLSDGLRLLYSRLIRFECLYSNQSIPLQLIYNRFTI